VDRLRELLERLASDEPMTDDELTSTEQELLGIFDEIRSGKAADVAADDVEALRSIAQSVEQIRAERTQREVVAAERAAEIAVLEQTIAPAPEPEPETETDDEPVAEAVELVPEPETEVVELVPVAAAAPAPAPAQPSTAELAAKTKVPAKPRAAVRTLADLDIALGDGTRVTDTKALARYMVERFESFGSVRAGYSENVKLASIRSSFPSELVLDGDHDLDKIDAVVAAAQRPESWDEALVASGGFCAPTEVRYGDFCLIAESIRPMRDGLPGFRADRGGVRVPQSPGLADITTAITVHDNVNDIAGDPKGCQTIDCATFDEYLTEAIVRCLSFGNFGARAFPEQVVQWNGLVMAAWARTAETELLDGIVAGSTAVTTAQVFGAARDLVEAVTRAAAAFRSRNRMRPDARLRTVMPSWVADLAAADLAYGLQSERGFLTDGRTIIREALDRAGVNVTFYVDSPSTGVSQVFGTQAAGALDAWPADVQWGLFEEGHWLFLDGGTLDLGIVRDSTLNQTNDFQNFAESFEGIAQRGCESLWVSSTVCVNGTSGAGVDAVIC